MEQTQKFEKQFYINALNGFARGDIINLISDISRTVIEINIKTDLCAFLNISGHVSWIEVQVSENKNLFSNVIYGKNYVTYCEYSGSPEITKLINSLKQIKSDLKELLFKYNNIKPLV